MRVPAVACEDDQGDGGRQQHSAVPLGPGEDGRLGGSGALDGGFAGKTFLQADVVELVDAAGHAEQVPVVGLVQEGRKPPREPTA